MESLAAEHTDVPDIVIALANGLVNLFRKQDEQDARDTIARLESFAAEHPDILDTVTAFTKGLEDLGYKKDKNSNG